MNRSLTFVVAATLACSAPSGVFGPLESPADAPSLPVDAAVDAQVAAADAADSPTEAAAPDSARDTVADAGACATGFGDCDGDGTCYRLATSAAHCGACGNRCPSHATCVAGECRSPSGLTCAAGLADCDNVESTGCETQLRASHTHCGACGNDCRSRGLWCRDGRCTE